MGKASTPRGAPVKRADSEPAEALPVRLSPDLIASLEAVAARLGGDLNLALEVVLRSHFEARDRAVLTPRQLMSVRSEAKSRGHHWTESELNRRGLPLYWSEEWLTAQLAKGLTFRHLSALYGYKKRTLSQYAKAYGIVQRENVSPDSYQEARRLFDPGHSRAEIAAHLSISEVTAGRLTRGRPAEKQRYTEEKRRHAGPYPASVTDIADRLFDGDKELARPWIYRMTNAGQLVHLRRGWYDLPKPTQDPPGLS